MFILPITNFNSVNNKPRIAFLGDQFSYHHLAGIAFFGADHDFIGTETFGSIINNVVSGDCNFGIIAVENTLAGDVPGNFELLVNSSLEIYGEITLKIALQFAALPGARITDIKTVYSHKMAIRETTAYFSSYPQFLFIETASTSSAVKFVAEQNSNNNAAIGSSTAIKHYHLEVLASGIDNSTDNRTRFLIICNKSPNYRTTNFEVKASLMLQTPEQGFDVNTLEEILQMHRIRFRRPLNNGNVYIETELTNKFQINNMLQEMEGKGVQTRVLGIYPPGGTVAGL